MLQPSLKSHVGKPNVYRLLELVMQIVPFYSHGLFVSEMAFDAAHQDLKFPLLCVTNQNAHIHAVILILANDWPSRVRSIFEIMKRGAGDKRRFGMEGLIQLYSEEAANEVHCNMPQVAEPRVEIEQFVCNILDRYL